MTEGLFTAWTQKDVTLKNRIVMSPMCMYSVENEDGHVTDWHMTHYTSRAVGQVGLIMIEATAVTEQGRISTNDLGIYQDEHVEGLQQLSSSMQKQGAKTAIQLAHAGRKAVVDGDIIAPSAIPFYDDSKVPKEMTKAEIEETIEAFKQGARRAKEAGFDIIEIHAAHGYLLSQFLSPLANHRNDEYGGSAENRYRIVKETIQAVHSVWDGPLFVRVSADEYHPEGNELSDVVQFATWMKQDGVDLIDCSSGGVVRTPIDVYPGYQLRHAETIKREADISTGAVGLITSGLQAEEIIKNERADLVFLGRELLRNPYWPRAAAEELGVDLQPPKQYERGW
ncbi:NADPH dehydrogenase NamA [Texcoconibacillus texcoconensis]|uniref:NADPH dehydrogenase n=1 Tax=Texcoconibacillus texcoconensis TaxID=1095777 RepID=A0A840QNR1_9BACI|nr:NADPH2 dehydrogenase [Texcoconibacillus texcoconensis]